MDRFLSYGSPINRSHPCMRGIVSRWKVVPWYASGPRFIDLAARNHGTLTNGPTWSGALGRQGGFGAISFTSASSRYVSLPSAGFPSGAAQFTIFLWVRPVSFAVDDYATPFSYGSAASSQAIILAEDGGAGTGKLRVGLYGGDVIVTTNTMTAGVWNALALTYDGATLEAYIGTPPGQIASGGTHSVTLGTVLANADIGRLITGAFGGQYYDGLIDDVMILNRGSSASEVRQLYDATSRRDDPTLNWIRPVTYFAPTAVVGGTILPQMIQQGLYAGSAA